MRGTRRPRALKVKGMKKAGQVVAKETLPSSVPWRWAWREAERRAPLGARARRDALTSP